MKSHLILSVFKQNYLHYWTSGKGVKLLAEVFVLFFYYWTSTASCLCLQPKLQLCRSWLFQSLWCVGRLGKKAGGVCCHVSHAEARQPSQHLFTPPGTRPAKTAGLFGRSVGWDGADIGVHDGGWDYRWAGVDWGVGQGGLWEEYTEHKRHVSKTEWAVTTYNPMDDNDIVLASTSGDLVQSVRVCLCVGGLMSAGVLMQKQEKTETGGLWKDAIRTQMTNVWPT